MWLTMRGALSDDLRVVDRRYCLTSMTGIATLVIEDCADSAELPESAASESPIAGTYSFTLERSAAAFALNQFLQRLTEPAHRTAFLSFPDETMTAAGLTDHERSLVSSRDWIGLIRHGAIFFGLDKLAAVLKLPNAVIYAGMRG